MSTRQVGIIGAGPAGVTAAQIIAREDMEVTLFSAEKVLPYYRQCLPELAFGDEQPENVFMNKLEWYVDNGIALRLDSKVKAFTPDHEVFLENNKYEKFDALIIATGACPIVLPFVNEDAPKNIFSLWNYSDAIKIRERAKSSKHMAIVGGGLIGVEVALRAEHHDLNITMIEKMPHLMSRYFENKASEVIEAQLHKRNIDFLLNNTVSQVCETYNNMIEFDLQDKDGFLCDFAVVAVGARFGTTIAVEAGLKTDRQILVDKHLQTSAPGIFAAGDIAQLSILRPCSDREAAQQGEIAGYNVLAYLNNKKLQVYEAQPAPIHLKHKDFELYAIGDVSKIGSNEEVLDFNNMKVYRGCIYENSALAGVQMVGSSKDISKFRKDFLFAKLWSILKYTKIFHSHPIENRKIEK